MAESLHILLGTSACLQWLCHSGERTVARGPLVNLIIMNLGHTVCLDHFKAGFSKCYDAQVTDIEPLWPSCLHMSGGYYN